MRVLLPVLFSAITLFAEGPQAADPAAPVPDNLSIPARLSKTIDTNKCKAGDVVEMRTVEPVLISNGVVMPENARLHGKVVGAASRQDDKPSWMVLLMEGAEWKDHSVPLHAFVAAQITMKAQVQEQNDSTFDGAINLPDIEHRRHTARVQTNPANDLPTSVSHPPRDATVEARDAMQLSYQGVDDVRVVQAKNGIMFLVSQKQHLKVPSGTMFMLRNRPTAARGQVTAEKAPGSTQ
jgi:hypothetical protein